jgi:hypothetical protein
MRSHRSGSSTTYATGKDATDGSIILDAMDLMFRVVVYKQPVFN